MTLGCERCGYHIPVRGLETAEARAELGRAARQSRVRAIQWLIANHGYDITDGKVIMNHITGEAMSGERYCYKCRSIDIEDGEPCPQCRSLVLDW